MADFNRIFDADKREISAFGYIFASLLVASNDRNFLFQYYSIVL